MPGDGRQERTTQVDLRGHGRTLTLITCPFRLRLIGQVTDIIASSICCKLNLWDWVRIVFTANVSLAAEPSWLYSQFIQFRTNHFTTGLPLSVSLGIIICQIYYDQNRGDIRWLASLPERRARVMHAHVTSISFPRLSLRFLTRSLSLILSYPVQLLNSAHPSYHLSCCRVMVLFCRCEEDKYYGDPSNGGTCYCKYVFIPLLFVECGNSAVECRTRNQLSPGSNSPFATVSKIGHFRSLHDAPVHSAV